MSGNALRVLLYGDLVVPNEYRLRSKADFPIEVMALGDNANPAELEEGFAFADAAVLTELRHPCSGMSRLRLIQTQSAGYEKVRLDCVPAAASVCNAFGHTRAAAEYAVMTMLMWTHRWKQVEDSFRGGSWYYSGATAGPFRDELNSKTVGIIGLGQMGKEVARRVRAMGPRVLGCSRSSGQPEVDRFYPLDQLDEFLPQCDFVILCIAHTAATESLIDARRLALMKRSAVLLNIARGPIVAERDLYEALARGTIAGAILDVWWQYPSATNPDCRGSAFPFHTLENVMMTPHSSQWTEQMMDRRWDDIVENLRRLRQGEPLRNVVRAPQAAPR